MYKNMLRYAATPLLLLAVVTLLLSPLTSLAQFLLHGTSHTASSIPHEPCTDNPSDTNDTQASTDSPQELLPLTSACIALPCSGLTTFNSELLLRLPAIFYAIELPPQNNA